MAKPLYNDVQTRAFTKIAYMDLYTKYNILKEDKHTDAIPLCELLSKEQQAELIALGVDADELNSWTMTDICDNNNKTGFYACVIETSQEPKQAAVAFRGSEDPADVNQLVNDWLKADLGLLNSTITNQQAEVRNFLSEKKTLLDKYDNLEMTGHSLGGNLAEYAAIVSEEYGLDDNIDSCVSLDGPGFSSEFMEEYKDEIAHMSDKMVHYRWSLVGSLLFDLDGVDYRQLKVTDEANDWSHCFSRHDTKYLDFDPNTKNFYEGEQDQLAAFTSYLSRGIDRLPKAAGDILLTTVNNLVLSYIWIKDHLFVNGELTGLGKAVIAAVSAIVLANLPTLVPILVLTVKVAIVAIIAITVAEMVHEFVEKLIVAVVDTICDIAVNAFNWAKEKAEQFKNAVLTAIKNVQKWWKENFDKGYKYATAHPQIQVNTSKLCSYANRIQKVQQRVSNVDHRLDTLYGQVGLVGLFNLLSADLLTGYSWRLSRCVNYLNDTARDFEAVESRLRGKL